MAFMNPGGNSSVYVGNIPYACSERDLATLFGRVGAIRGVRIVYDRDSGRSKGFAFIDFMDPLSAEAAVNMNGVDFHGRAIRVNWANVREQ